MRYDENLKPLETAAKDMFQQLKNITCVSRSGALIRSILATSGEMVAEAEFILNVQKGDVLNDLLVAYPNMQPNQQKISVDAACAYAMKVWRLLEKVNKAAATILKQ